MDNMYPAKMRPDACTSIQTWDPFRCDVDVQSLLLACTLSSGHHGMSYMDTAYMDMAHYVRSQCGRYKPLLPSCTQVAYATDHLSHFFAEACVESVLLRDPSDLHPSPKDPNPKQGQTHKLCCKCFLCMLHQALHACCGIEDVK